MKKIFMCLCLALVLLAASAPKAIFVTKTLALQTELDQENVSETANEQGETSLLAIVIDDFGGYERAGVKELLESDVDITCAIMPYVENSEADYTVALKNKKEVIVHMPMQAHVGLPESWYGPTYIKNHDTSEVATKKVSDAIKTMPEAKGFNIHIGSGVSRNQELMKAMYNFSKQNDLIFLDSRTNVGDKCEEASQLTDSIYLGRDIFLEPHKNRTYSGVRNRLYEAEKTAESKGYAIVIGHVGAEGGINTARAIIDFAANLNDHTEIVPLSEIYKLVKESKYQ